MHRFVVLTHNHPFPHWDLLLDVGEQHALRTWRLLAEPLSTECIAVEPLPDHRRIYLDYEGPISGDRGSVSRWDSGAYEVAAEDDAQLVLRFHGNKLSGEYVIDHAAGQLQSRALKSGE